MSPEILVFTNQRSFRMNTIAKLLQKEYTN